MEDRGGKLHLCVFYNDAGGGEVWLEPKLCPSILSMSRPQLHPDELVCACSIIDEEGQEWEVGTFTHDRGYERTPPPKSTQHCANHWACAQCGLMFWPIFCLCTLLTFPLAMQTATTSELPTRQKEREAGRGGEWGRWWWWWSDRKESQGCRREVDEEKRGGRCACMAVSQHIFNEPSDMMCCWVASCSASPPLHIVLETRGERKNI